MPYTPDLGRSTTILKDIRRDRKHPHPESLYLYWGSPSFLISSHTTGSSGPLVTLLTSVLNTIVGLLSERMYCSSPGRTVTAAGSHERLVGVLT